GTTQGVIKGVVDEGDKKIPLSESILGRVSRVNISNPVTDEVIVRENELITVEIARKIEELGIEKIQVRSPMTCEAELGVCSLCYGMDLSTSKLVEEGMAVGIIAAQSIGEPGTQLTMRTFHIGGAAAHSAEESEIKTKYAGYIRFTKMEIVDNPSLGGKLVLSSKADGGIDICNKRGQSRETYPVPEGAILAVEEGQYVEAGQTLASIDPHSKLLIAKSSGIVQFGNIVDGDTVQSIYDPATGQSRLSVVDLKGDRHPHIDVRTFDGGKVLEGYHLPSKTQIEVQDGQIVERGTILAKMPQNASGTQDITSGLPRVTEIFEARKPKDPAVIAEISGTVEILEKRHHGKKVVVVRSAAEHGGEPIERMHEVPQGKRIRVFTGDEVRAGQPLTDGLLVPHDILRISGEEAVQDYLVQEVQTLYRSQKVGINDKHIEVIVSQMLRKVKIEDGGDTALLAGDVVDKFEFLRKNRELDSCVKIEVAGDVDFEVGEIVSREVFDAKNAEYELKGGRPAIGKKPRLAIASTQLLGITKAAVQSSSFLSAASFQETTKVLVEAALAYKVDRLVGLKENVTLGRLIPAGTGFRKYQAAHWNYRQDAAQRLADAGFDFDDSAFPLLNDAPNGENVRSFEPVGDVAAKDAANDENATFSQFADETLAVSGAATGVFVDEEESFPTVADDAVGFEDIPGFDAEPDKGEADGSEF
ncbi:MAG: hypothetical protein IJY15_13680, partial [Thermoguttaceae bacterium]|nr:hypothetical protein [Thermoguttaceae bacterium]